MNNRDLGKKFSYYVVDRYIGGLLTTTNCGISLYSLWQEVQTKWMSE